MDDTALYDIYIAGRGSAALAVAVRLGLFELFACGVRNEAQVAEQKALSPRGTRALLRALVGLRLLERDGDVYCLSPLSARFLVPGKAEYLGGLFALEMEHAITPERLLAAVKSGEQQVYPGVEVWSAHEGDPEQAARFTAAMHSISARPAQALAEQYDFSRHRRLLDLGGGSGVFVLAALERHARLEAVLVDLAPVCAIAERTFAERGLGERARTAALDMFEDELPRDADVVLLSQILHDWPPSRGEALLARIFAALPSGGVLLVHEKLIEDDGGPVANALVDLDMLFWTEGQQLGASEVKKWLAEAGFRDIEVVPTIGYWSVVIGRKRSAGS